jgi:hypothetical protein
MTATNTAAVEARERQLEWLLGEVHGGVAAGASQAAARERRGARSARWLAAALMVLAATTAFAVAALRDDASSPVVEPSPESDENIEWHECHGPAALTEVPADVVNLRCFDFDDAALAQLAHFTKLEWLDLGGMDVNEKGYSTALPITDEGVAHLGKLPSLRWLSLEGCHQVKGERLAGLEAVPRLEHLDLTFTGVRSPAVERLARLPSLRELSLSFCMDFHGSALAAVAKIPGLRRLELRGCTTLSAADVMHLAKLTELRHLDLRDCQGRYLGQRAAIAVDGHEPEPEPAPVEDGIGVTDASIAALGRLPLETLLLGGCTSLTDAVGPTLAAMPTLRELDLSDLPKTTGALLARVPSGLTALGLSSNRHYTDATLRSLPALPELRELRLANLPGVTDRGIAHLLDGRPLRELVLGEPLPGFMQSSPRDLTDELLDAMASLHDLRRLQLYQVRLDGRVLHEIAALPALEELHVSSGFVASGALAELAAATSLRRLTLRWLDWMTAEDLVNAGPNLRELDLRGAKLFARDVRKALAGRRDLVVTMPHGQREVFR